MRINLVTDIAMAPALYRAWIDLETEKVPLAEPFPMATGHPLKTVWQPMIIGLGYERGGFLAIELSYDWQTSWPTYLRSLKQYQELRYAATREFDEMVAKGRFTNARRAHLPAPGPWPHIPERLFTWTNIKKELAAIRRSPDIASKDVPEAWNRGQPEIVLTHLIKDVVELVAGDPTSGVDPESREVRLMMTNNGYVQDYLPRYL
jgi:hypothetical protein